MDSLNGQYLSGGFNSAAAAAASVTYEAESVAQHEEGNGDRAKAILLEISQIMQNSQMAVYEKASGLQSLRDRVTYEETPQTYSLVRDAFIQAFDEVVPRNTVSDFYRRIANMPAPAIEAAAPAAKKFPALNPFSLAEFKTDDKSVLPELEKIRQELPNLPILTCEELPVGQFSNGVMGVLFQADLRDENVLFKLEKRYGGGSEREPYLPRYKNSDRGMVNSFYQAIGEARMLMEAAQGPYFPKCHGLVWVKSKNQWGIAYEKIEGSNFRNFLWDISYFYQYRKNKTYGNCTELKAPTYSEMLQILIDCTRGLQKLDAAGFPHTDVKPENIMIRNSDKRGIILDHAQSQKWKTPRESLESRQQLGTLLYQGMVPWEDIRIQRAPNSWDIKEQKLSLEDMLEKEIPESAARMIVDCWSDKPVSEYGWDAIIETLSQLKATL